MNITKKIQQLELKFKKNLGGNLFGLYQTTFVGTGMEFSEVKTYDYGENIKNIDWKTTAKKQELYVKKFEEERDLNIIFALDLSGDLDFGSKYKTKKDLMIELVYILGINILQNHDNMGALFFSEDNKEFLHPQKSEAVLYKIIQKVLSQTENKKCDLSELGKELVKKNIKKSVVIVCSDSMSYTDEKWYKKLSGENQVIYVNIFDEVENNGFDIVGDIALGDRKNSVFFESEKIKNYKNQRILQLQKFKKFLAGEHVSYLCLDTSMNLYEELRKFFIQANIS